MRSEHRRREDTRDFARDVMREEMSVEVQDGSNAFFSTEVSKKVFKKIVRTLN